MTVSVQKNRYRAGTARPLLLEVSRMSFSLAPLATRRVASLKAARAQRAERRHLLAELDAYSTPADRAELDAILGRHTEQELSELAERTGRPYAA